MSDMDLSQLHAIKAALVVIAVILTVLLTVAERRGKRDARNVFGVALAVLAIISVCAYFDFGQYPKFGHFRNPHDLFHYYMGSKYSNEVGYLNLYQCMAVANWEDQKKIVPDNIRSMETYGFLPTAGIIKNAAQYKKPFTEARWTDFKKDCRYFASLLTKRRWATVGEDMGYNATPVWNMVARFLTNHIATSNATGMAFLVSLDLVLLCIMTLLVVWAFEWRTALLALVFFCTCYCMSYTHIRGAFLRLDWVTMLVMSLCLVKKEHYKTAGVLMAYSGMARMFPFIFLFGMGGKFAWNILGALRKDGKSVPWNKEHLVSLLKSNRKYLEFFATVTVVSLLLVGVSVMADGGFGHWSAFFKKIGLHDRHITPVRVGFKYVFLSAYLNPWAKWSGGVAQAFDGLKLWWLAVQFLVMVVSFFAVKNLDEYEAISYGYVLAYFLTAPTFYYHVMLIAALFLFLPKRTQPFRLAGTIVIFAISPILFLLETESIMPWPKHFFLMSWILLFFSVFMAVTAFLAHGSHRTDPTDPTDG